jgi:hypothetical protein
MMVVCCSTRFRTDENRQTRSAVTIDRRFLFQQREISVTKTTLRDKVFYLKVEACTE